MKTMPARKPREKMPDEVRWQVEKLKSPDWRARTSATGELGSLRHASAIPFLIHTLEKDEHGGPRGGAALALGRIGHASVVPHLAKALLQDSNDNVRDKVAQALGETGQESAIPHLVKLLRDPNWYMREIAVESLGLMGHKRAIPPLVKALDDEHWSVSKKAMRVLGKANARAIPYLAKALKNKDKGTVSLAAIALGTLGQNLQGEHIKGKEAKAIQLVGQYFHKDEEPSVILKAYEAALNGKVTEKNARLYVKQLRAVKGSLK